MMKRAKSPVKGFVEILANLIPEDGEIKSFYGFLKALLIVPLILSFFTPWIVLLVGAFYISPSSNLFIRLGFWLFICYLMYFWYFKEFFNNDL